MPLTQYTCTSCSLVCITVVILSNWALLSDISYINVSFSIPPPGGVCVVPINDIRGLEGMSYTKNEKALRCRLAAAYRLADLHGWTQGINNHISLRISQVSV